MRGRDLPRKIRGVREMNLITLNRPDLDFSEEELVYLYFKGGGVASLWDAY